MSGGFPEVTPAGAVLPASLDLPAVAVGAVAGGCGGAAVPGVAGGRVLPWLLAGLVCGAVTGAVAGPYADSPGEGLVRGLGLGVLSWVVTLAGLALLGGGMAMRLPVRLPLFVKLVVFLNGPAGLAVGVLAAVREGSEPVRAALTGGVAGLVTGGLVAASTGGAPVRALLGATPPAPLAGGPLVHVAVAGLVGASFGALFGTDLRGAGSAVALGLGYGVFWWLAGALTLGPVLGGESPAWTAPAARRRLGALVAHAVFGTALGASYAALDGLWRGLVRDPDPVTPGTGARSRQLGAAGLRGAVASLVGAVGFGLVLLETGEFASIAALVGGSSTAVGVVVHAVVATVVGVTYGALFRYEAPDLGAGVMWGTLYGVVWWVLGPLTLLPALLGAPVAWTPAAVGAAVPMLVGHVVYGAATGLVLTVVERRRAAWAAVSPRVAARERRRRRPFATVAPSLWLFVLGTTVVVPATVL